MALSKSEATSMKIHQLSVLHARTTVGLTVQFMATTAMQRHADAKKPFVVEAILAQAMLAQSILAQAILAQAIFAQAMLA